MATVRPFITGLNEPLGMVLDAQKNLLVCNYGANEILKFSLDGKAQGTFATDLRGPTSITSADGGQTMFVAERADRRVIRIGQGKKENEMEDVPEPTGVIWDYDAKRGDSDGQTRKLWVVSHSTSKVYRREYLNGYVERRLLYAPVATPTNNGGEHIGFNGIALDGGALFISDESTQSVRMLTEGGRIATFASGIEKPSGLAVSPGYPGALYVASEGNGGQLLRLDSEGGKTVVAEKLGRPHTLLFLDAKTLLVSNWDGTVWKVVLP